MFLLDIGFEHNHTCKQKVGHCCKTTPYLSTFRNFHGGDSARIDVFGPFFFTTKRAGNIFRNFHGGDIFLTYKQA